MGHTTSTDEKIFSGFISEHDLENGVVKITCKDKMWDLVRKNVNKVYEASGPQAGQISAIASDLISTYGGLTPSVQATGTADGQTVSEFRCDHADIYSRLKALASAVNFQIWYDPVNDTVHFEPKGYNNSGETLTVGGNILGLPKWKNDTSKMINDLRVDGAVSNTQIRLPSGTGVGQIGTTSGFATTGITLDKTPQSVELIMDAATPPTEVKIGGTSDSSSGNFYYVDQENKLVTPATGTTFTTSHYAIVNYTWLAPSPVHQYDSVSIATYGKFQKQVTLSDVQTVADVEGRTQDILSKFATPFLVGEIMVKNLSTLNYKIGDKITIVDAVSNPNVNSELVITKEIVKYPGSMIEIVVGDEGIRLADWQSNVEDRLKRLEENVALQNQDLLLELVDFGNSFKITPRYQIITTANIAGDTLIYGSSDFGIWGTARWGSTANISFVLGNSLAAILGTSKLGSQTSSQVNHFIRQFDNSYTEDFIDDDFEDSDGTATGWTSGSLDFTSGQIGLSSAIDYNNGTITVATLTGTETSGSFTYALSANGGTNFENVTSGTAHTFTNTGTDLRWRVTENATSTGEISKIEVTTYH
jgi:hypothetical protein